MEQALGLGNLPQHGDLCPAAGLAEDSHVAGVAAKLCDIVPHPAQGLNQVGHAHVYGVPVLIPEGGHVKVAEGVEPVVYRYDHHIVQLCQIIAVVANLLNAGASGVAAAVNPEHNRQFFAGLAGRGPDIQI